MKKKKQTEYRMGNLYISKLVLLRERVESWEEYPFSLPCIRRFEDISFEKQVTCILGDNATGKTTILEAIARLSGLNIEGGSRHHEFSATGRISRLADAMRLYSGGLTMSSGNGFYYRAEHFAHFLQNVGPIDHIDFKQFSRGEAFQQLVEHCFDCRGLYLLDEPEVALTPLRQIALLRIIHDLVELGSQFIIVSHSPIILAYPNAMLYELTIDGQLILQNYESTEIYQIMHSFMLHRDSIIKEILTENNN